MHNELYSAGDLAGASLLAFLCSAVRRHKWHLQVPTAFNLTWNSPPGIARPEQPGRPPQRTMTPKRLHTKSGFSGKLKLGLVFDF
jgi:hypothetical protein